jgi:hypothetical protein
MKYSLIASLLFCFSISFAQLSVQNDAFVFVSNQVLFVTDDVNIDDVDSKIYLREEAQLIQGTGTTGNSGEGQLSVYQEGNVDKWAYNYWCSPVGNNSFAGIGNEVARVQLLNDATGLTTFFQAAFIPGPDGIASPLTISDRWLWTYVSSSLYADWDYVGETGPINPGLGFTMKGNPSSNQRYDFRGKPNNGTITNTVGDGDFTLVGNPYPSAMDSAAFIHDTQNAAAILPTLFYWEQDTSIPSTQSHVLQDYVGGYSEFTINPAGTLISSTPATFFKYDEQDNVLPLPPGPPGLGAKTARRYIPIGQGFMVEGSPMTSGIVRAKNEHREFQKEGAESVFFRTDNSEGSNNLEEIQYQDNGLPLVPEDYKRFRINVEFTVNSTNYVRQVLLNFNENATMSHDRGLELHRSDNLNSDAYFVQEDDIFSGLAYPFEESLTIPLVVDIEVQQPLRFRIFDIQNFDESQEIFMHDLENDIYVNLRNQDYDLNIEPGNYTDRFEIVFTSEAALDVDEFDIDTLTINQNNGMYQLSVLNPKSLDVTSIEVYDVTGKLLLNGNYNSVLNRYELSTISLSDGVYVVNVKSNARAVKSQKIIIKN